MDISTEVVFKTARSGGSGGQHVNKVETMVEAYWHVERSVLLSDEEKERVIQKLSSKINKDGWLQVKSQVSRTQLENKKIALLKIIAIVNKALIVPRKRKTTKPGKAAKESRLAGKKNQSEKKELRKKITF